MHFPHKTSSLNGHIKQSSESDHSDSYEYDIAESPKLLIGDTKIVYISPLTNNLLFRGARNAVLLWNAYKIL